MKVKIKRVADGRITLQETSNIAIITINRPAAKNALTIIMWRDLARLVTEITQNKKMKVAILRGVAGGFTAGSDIKEFFEKPLSEINDAFRAMEKTISIIENLSIPVISVINGPAMGAGLILSLACDIRIGSHLTRMGIPVGKLGIKLPPSFVRRIVRIIGPSKTKELVFTNRIYDAESSYHIGLIDHLIESDKLDHYALRFASLIASQSRASLKAVKYAVELSYNMKDVPWDFVDPIDFREGCLAFIEKRKPIFY